MSHHGAHNFGAWTLERETNPAGEVQTILVRRCTWPRCGAVDKERGAIVEPPQSYHYARYLNSGSEPDD